LDRDIVDAVVPLQMSPAGAMRPFGAPGIPILTTMAGVGGSTVCIPAGMMTRGGVATPLMAGHPMSAFAERGLAIHGVSTDGASSTAGSAVHPVFNLSKLSAQLAVSEHGRPTIACILKPSALQQQCQCNIQLCCQKRQQCRTNLS